MIRHHDVRISRNAGLEGKRMIQADSRNKRNCSSNYAQRYTAKAKSESAHKRDEQCSEVQITHIRCINLDLPRTITSPQGEHIAGILASMEKLQIIPIMLQDYQ